MSASPNRPSKPPSQSSPSSARTSPTPARESSTPTTCRNTNRSLRVARESNALQSGIVASISAPREASIRRRLPLKVTGKTVKRIAPRSASNGRSRHSMRSCPRVTSSRRTNSRPPWPNRKTARLRGGTSCTATRTATTELPKRAAATNAAHLAASRWGITAVWVHRRCRASEQLRWRSLAASGCRVHARGAPPHRLAPPTPGAVHGQGRDTASYAPRVRRPLLWPTPARRNSRATRSRHAQPPPSLLTFPEQGMSRLICQDGPDGHSGKGRDAAERADEEELLPDGDPDIGVDFCGDLGSLQHVLQSFYARTHPTAQRFQYDLPLSGRLRYDSRCFDGRNEVGGRAEPRIVSGAPGDVLGIVYSILQR